MLPRLATVLVAFCAAQWLWTAPASAANRPGGHCATVGEMSVAADGESLRCGAVGLRGQRWQIVAPGAPAAGDLPTGGASGAPGTPTKIATGDGGAADRAPVPVAPIAVGGTGAVLVGVSAIAMVRRRRRKSG